MIPKSNHSYNTRQLDKVESFYCRIDTFKNSFFPSVIDEWNELKTKIRIADSFLKFWRLILNNIFNPISLKYLTRFHLELTHLNKRKFKHNFQDCINPLCSCSLEPESNFHFFLRCHNYFTLHAGLINDLNIIDENILKIPSFVQFLLSGDPKYNLIHNCQILNASINFMLKSKRFKGFII